MHNPPALWASNLVKLQQLIPKRRPQARKVALKNLVAKALQRSEAQKKLSLGIKKPYRYVDGLGWKVTRRYRLRAIKVD